MDSKTSRFDDSQCAIRRPRAENNEEFSYAIEEGCMGRPRPDLEYHDAGAGSERVAKHLAEIAVQRDERSPFSRAHFEQFLVRRASQPFTGHCNGIMAGGADQIGCAPAEVLVKFESHAAL